MPEFDLHERRNWAGQAAAYARSFAQLCAHPAGELLDMAGVGAATRLLDVGTGSGTVARLGRDRGAAVAAVDAEDSMVRATAAEVPQADVRLGILPDLPFAGGVFDAVVANFVINHVGDPRAAALEMRRVAAPGGTVAVSIWPQPAGTAQSLWWQAIDDAGAVRPAAMPRVAAHLDFPRNASGVTGLLASAGLSDIRCRTVEWVLRVEPRDWWSGPANGLGTAGHVIAAQTPEMVARIKASFDRLSAPYLDGDGMLALPTAALLAVGAVK